MQSLRNVNLNLLPVLHALVHHRSVTRAGEALNMSQSAVSDALANLRHVFGDELLIRGGRQMLLTDLAKALIPQIEEAVGAIQQLLAKPELDAATLTRQFTIATADSVMMTIGPPLVAALAEQAPAASIQFVSVGTTAPAQGRSGEIDLLLGPAEVLEGLPGYRSARLYDDEFVCIMRRNHPLSRGRLTAEAYWSAPHASYRPDAFGGSTLETTMARRAGERSFERVLVPQFNLLPFFVETSDCLAMVSRRVAERMRRNAGIVLRDLPFEHAPIPMSMFWTDITHNDPAHRWLRELLERLGSLA